jgi:hypothetical protein
VGSIAAIADATAVASQGNPPPLNLSCPTQASLLPSAPPFGLCQQTSRKSLDSKPPIRGQQFVCGALSAPRCVPFSLFTHFSDWAPPQDATWLTVYPAWWQADHSSSHRHAFEGNLLRRHVRGLRFRLRDVALAWPEWQGKCCHLMSVPPIFHHGPNFPCDCRAADGVHWLECPPAGTSAAPLQLICTQKTHPCSWISIIGLMPLRLASKGSPTRGYARMSVTT